MNRDEHLAKAEEYLAKAKELASSPSSQAEKSMLDLIAFANVHANIARGMTPPYGLTSRDCVLAAIADLTNLTILEVDMTKRDRIVETLKRAL